MIPLKLVKAGDESIAEPLTLAKNYYLFQESFPDNNKAASLVLTSKRNPNKHSGLNYRPITIFNTFSTLYEKEPKDKIMMQG